MPPAASPEKLEMIQRIPCHHYSDRLICLESRQYSPLSGSQQCGVKRANGKTALHLQQL